MASQFRGYKFSPDLADIADLLAQGNRYPTGAAFVKGLIRYAALCQARHVVSLKWAELSLEDQDKLDAALLRRVKEGRGMTAKQAATVDWRDL